MSSRIESATTFDQIAGVKHGIRFDNPRLIEFLFYISYSTLHKRMKHRRREFKKDQS